MNDKLLPYADLKYKARTYKDKETGKEKGVWVTVGTLFSTPHGSHMSVKLDTVPVGEFNGWLSVYKREESSQQPITQNEVLEKSGDFVPTHDDIDDKPIDLSSIPF